MGAEAAKVSSKNGAKNGAKNEVVVHIPKDSLTKGGAAYGQNPLVVKQGTTVRWVNDDTLVHTVTSENGELNSGDIEPGQEFSHVFKKPGNFPYYCTLHGKTVMYGQVNVQ